jgi:hypothetical protein
MTRPLLASTLLIALAGCRPTSTPVAPDPLPPPSNPRPAHQIASDEPGRDDPTGPDAVGPSQPLPAADEARREEGLRAFDQGRYTEARRIFAELLTRHRSNASLQALAAAAQKAEDQAREGAAMTLANMPARALAEPPWEATVRRKLDIAGAGPAPKLVVVSQKRNRITDDEEWFQTHGLQMPTWAVPNRFTRTEGDLPAEVPARYGDLPIVEAISHPDHAVLLYGPDYSGGTVLAVVAGDGEVRALFDFSAWRTAPKTKAGDSQFVDQRIVWAQAHDGVLYVSTGHRTYASSSGGANAYISALDLETGELLWRSAPLVANAGNFLLRDGWIFTGYGFTAEPDFLYVLDASNGKVHSKQKIKSGPDVLLMKDDQLYVRCYDTDYVFDVR